MALRLCFLAIIFFSAPWSRAIGAIFNKDDRTAVELRKTPQLAAIGKVRSGLHWGTGFLISECHVLTVRHIFGGRKRPVGRKATFRVTLPTTGHALSWGEVIASGDIPHKPRERSGDWALIHLDSCLGRHVGYFDIMKDLALSAHYATEPVRIAGFPRGAAGQLVMDPSCRVLQGSKLEWFNDCATLQGSSGSPIFRQSNVGGYDQIHVVGMQTSGYDTTVVRAYDPSIANRATRIDILANAVASHLPQRPVSIGHKSE